MANRIPPAVEPAYDPAAVEDQTADLPPMERLRAQVAALRAHVADNEHLAAERANDSGVRAWVMRGNTLDWVLDRIDDAAAAPGSVYVGDYPPALVCAASDWLDTDVDLDVREIGRRLRASVEPATQDTPAPAERLAPVGSWWEVVGAVIPTVGQIQGSRTILAGAPVFEVDVYRRGEPGSKRTFVRLDLLRSVWAPIETVPDWVEVAW